ncbi:MAG: GIY-YIG nuclease family protein [Eubacteriales bacterium]
MMDRKKELKLQYKQMKPKMGVFMIRSRANKKYYIMATKDLRGVVNGTIVRLNGGIHVNLELQKEWNDFGEENFVIDILEELKYDKDESKTDYSEELALLQMVWEEKLIKEGMKPYKKKI